MLRQTARIAAAARRQLDTLNGLTVTEALEVQAATSGVLLARIEPLAQPRAIAMLRASTTSAMLAALRKPA